MEDDGEFPLMNAILYKAYGPPDDPAQVLRISNYQDIPELEDDDLLVEVFCFSVVRFDVKMLLEHPLGTGTPSVTSPMIPCIDGAGVVCETGDGVTRFQAGDCVFFSMTEQPGKAAAEWVRVPQSMAALKPRVVPFKDMACLGSAAAAAIEGVDWMEFKAGSEQVILVLAGATDVGCCVIRYCKYRRWIVHATAAGDEACEWCVRMGADQVYNTDEADGKWVKLFKPHSVNGVFETRGAPSNFADAETVLVRSGGCFVSIAPKEGHTVADAASFLPAYLWRKIVSPFSYYTFTEYDCATPDRMDKIAKLAAGGVFVPITNGTYKFDLTNVQQAFSQVAFDVVPGRPVVVIKDHVVTEKMLRSSTQTMAIEPPKAKAEASTASARTIAAPISTKAGDARAQAKAEAERSWVAFKKWCDRVNKSIEALSSPPRDIADLKQRQETLKGIKADVQSEGKTLYENLEKAVADAVKAGIKAGVSEGIYKENAAKVSENVRMADKAISKMISKMEKESAKAVDEAQLTAKRKTAEDAWAAFGKWCAKVSATIDSLSAPPEGLEDLRKREGKIKTIKSELLVEGKVLYDKAESAISTAVEANVKFVGGISLSMLKENASRVSSSVQTADKAISKMIKKLEEKESQKKKSSEKAALKQKAMEQLDVFRDWCDQRRGDMEKLSTPPKGVEDLRERAKKVAELKAEMGDRGKQLYEKALSHLAHADGVTENDLQDEIQGVVIRIKKGEKAINMLLAKEEEKVEQEKAEQQRQKDGKVRAQKVLEKFHDWCDEKKGEIEALSAAPKGVEDLRARVEKVSSLKKNIKDVGKGLYDACLEELDFLEVSEVELQTEIQSVASKAKTADKAIKGLLKKEEEKEAQKKSEKEKAEQKIKSFNAWFEKTKQQIETLSSPPEGLEDLRKRAGTVSEIKLSLESEGKVLLEDAMEVTPEFQQSDLKDDFEEVSVRLQKADKAISMLLKKEEEKQEKELEALKKKANKDLERFRNWCEGKRKEVKELSVSPEGVEDLKKRLEVVGSLRDEVENMGSQMYEECMAQVKYTSDATEADLQEEIGVVASQIKTAEKAISKLLAKEEEKERELEAERQREEELAREKAERQEREEAKALGDYKDFCQAMLKKIRGLMTPDGMDEIKEREDAVSKFKQDVAREGTDLLQNCLNLNLGEDLRSSLDELNEELDAAEKENATFRKMELMQNPQSEEESKADEEAAKARAEAEAKAAAEAEEEAARKREELERQKEQEEREAEEREREKEAKRKEREEQDRLEREELERERLEEERLEEERREEARQRKERERLEKEEAEKKEEEEKEKENGRARVGSVPENQLTKDDLDKREELENVAKLRKWCEKQISAIETLQKEEKDTSVLLERLADIKADIEDEGQIFVGACNLDLLDGEVTESDLQKELKKVERRVADAEKEAKEGSIKGDMDRACAEFRGWMKDIGERITTIGKEPKGVKDLRERVQQIADCKTEVSSVGKKRFDKVLGFMKEYPQMTFGVKKSDMEDGIRGVAAEVTKTQKKLNALLKAAEERVKDKKSSKQEKAEEAYNSFKQWTKDKDDEVAKILENLPDSLELLKKAEARIDEMRGEMRAEGRQLFDACCALNPPEVKAELKNVVKGVVDRMKKAAGVLEEKVTEGIEREKNAPPAQQEEIVDEIEQASKDADGGESREDKRKAAMDRLREKKSQREAGGTLDAESKKESLALLREKMLQRKDKADEEGGGEGEELSNTERKNSILERLKSRKKVDGEEGGAEEEGGGDGDEISDTDRKNSLLERIKSRKKVDDVDKEDDEGESKEGEGAEGDAAQDKKAALLAKIKSKKKLDEDGGEDGDGEGGDGKEDKKAALLEKIKSRKKLAEEGGEEEAAAEDEDPARDRKATLLEKIQSRKKLDEDGSGGGDGGDDQKEDRKAALERLKAKKLAREESLKEAGGDGASDARAAAIERLKEKKLARDASK